MSLACAWLSFCGSPFELSPAPWPLPRALVAPALAAFVLVVRVLGRCVLGGGTHHDCLRQKWHALCVLSQYEHSGVICPAAHCSVGHRSSAKHQSQKRPVTTPQSTQGLVSISLEPNASTSMARRGEGHDRWLKPTTTTTTAAAEVATVGGSGGGSGGGNGSGRGGGGNNGDED